MRLTISFVLLSMINLCDLFGVIMTDCAQSKLYEEKQLISRPRRPFIKEDIMQINLNVKNMVMHSCDEKLFGRVFVLIIS